MPKGFTVVEPPVEGAPQVIAEPAKPAVAAIVPPVTVAEPAKVAEPATITDPVIPKPAVPEPTKEVDYGKWLADETGGKIKTKEDLKAYIQKEVIDLEDGAFLDAYKYAKNGGKITDWLEAYTKDYKNADPIEVLANDLVLNTGISKEDALYKLNKQYKQDIENFTEDEVKDGKIQAAIDSKKAKDAFIAKQEALKVPQAVKDREAQLQQMERQEKEWQGIVESSLSAFKGLTLQIPDGADKTKEFHYEIPEAELSAVRKTLKEHLSKPNEAMVQALIQSERYNNAEGVNTLAQDMYFILNRDKISMAIARQAQSDATEALLDKVSPAGVRKLPEGGNERANETQNQAIRRQMAGQ